MKNYIEFIEKHVVTELIKQGYEQSVARISADVALEHYRRNAASAKGKIFADCLHVAKVWADNATGSTTHPYSLPERYESGNNVTLWRKI